MFIGLRFVAVDSLRTRHSSWSIELQVGKPLDRHLDKKRNQIVACRFTNVWLISSCNAGPLFGLCPLSMVVHLCDFSALDILCQYRCRSVFPPNLTKWSNLRTRFDITRNYYESNHKSRFDIHGFLFLFT